MIKNKNLEWILALNPDVVREKDSSTFCAWKDKGIVIDTAEDGSIMILRRAGGQDDIYNMWSEDREWVELFVIGN